MWGIQRRLNGISNVVRITLTRTCGTSIKRRLNGGSKTFAEQPYCARVGHPTSAEWGDLTSAE